MQASGPFGSFLVPDGEHELVYVGGGAGMAPIRSHLSYLFDTLRTTRRVTYWYGARSRQEAFYEDYFRELEAQFPTSGSTSHYPRRSTATRGTGQPASSTTCCAVNISHATRRQARPPTSSAAPL